MERRYFGAHNDKKRKTIRLTEDKEEEKDTEKNKRAQNSERKLEVKEYMDGENSRSVRKENNKEKEVLENPKPIGVPMYWKNHYESFEYRENNYKLGDFVRLTPKAIHDMPYVTVIKDIYQIKDGDLMITGRRLYSPNEAEKKEGGKWKSDDRRELFYSFHDEEILAESIMGRCTVHFVPSNKQLPNPRVHPGFVVQKVYDTVHKILLDLTDRAFEGDLKKEIDLLLQKTESRIGNRLNSNYRDILELYGALTGNSQRDSWRERLLQAVQHACDNGASNERHASGSKNKEIVLLLWPDDAVRAVHNLEKVSYKDLHKNITKYKAKLNSLVFNLQKNVILAIRLLSGELEPSRLLNMSPNELKEGVANEEIPKEGHDENENVQMTDAQCSRCNESKVGLRDIIHTGHLNRYKLECIKCGHIWYVPSGEVSILAADVPTSSNIN